MVIVWSCIPVTPPFPKLLEKPVLGFVGMAPVFDTLNGYRESIHIAWTTPSVSTATINSFTLLRRIPPDSVFDIFTGSRKIPAGITDFYDDLAGFVFPVNGFDTIFYRICAVDENARTGDTSETVTVILAPQANMTRYDTAYACFQWDSWIRGGVFSWCTVWSDSVGASFTSSTEQTFPDTDEPARFSACFPDSIALPVHGRWYYALYIKANESSSLKVGSIYAP